MNVPFVDLKAQFNSIRPEILSALKSVCEQTSFVLGPFVNEFEKSFAKFVNAKYCIGLNNGTSAVQLAVGSLTKPGDEVITTPNTFIATAEAITAAGGKVVFVDIDEDTYNMDSALLEGVITPRTKAIVPVHLCGQPADMDPIMDIAKRHDLAVIEDAAQAHGAEYKGRKAGSIGDAAAFSFYPGKNLGAYGESGAVTTNSDGVMEFARLYRDHGSREKYVHEFEGHNMRMEGFQGAVLGVKLKYIEKWTEARRQHASYYTELLSEVQGIKTPQELDDTRHVYHLYMVRVKERERLQHYFSERGISSGFHYKYPLHLQKAYSYLGYRQGDFPVTERVMEEIISLPMFPELKNEQIEYVVENIRNFLRQ